jgi:hypothetical protein
MIGQLTREGAHARRTLRLKRLIRLKLHSDWTAIGGRDAYTDDVAQFQSAEGSSS